MYIYLSQSYQNAIPVNCFASTVAFKRINTDNPCAVVNGDYKMRARRSAGAHQVVKSIESEISTE